LLHARHTEELGGTMRRLPAPPEWYLGTSARLDFAEGTARQAVAMGSTEVQNKQLARSWGHIWMQLNFQPTISS
jgi:hypothetical protein